MALPAVSVRRPITVLMATLAVVTFGLLAARGLPVDLLPDLSYPTLTVQTVYADAAPVSVEQFVTRPVEEAVGVIPGVREMRSTSRSGLSEVVLEFEWDEDMDFIALDVREKLGLVELPREAEPPRVLRFDPSLDPIVRLALAGDRGLDDLRQLADRWLKPRLEAVHGVASARVRGGLDAEIKVEADEDRLASLGLTLDDLATALQAENVNQPGGTLKDFNAVYLVRTLHEFDDLEQLRRTVVRDAGTRRVRVEDVARVSRGHRDRQEITRSGSREVVELALHREGSANTVAVAASIAAALQELRADLPADLSIELLTDQSRYIADAVTQVWSAALMGGLLAILVLYFFLRDLASTVIIAISIPVSVAATFLPMQQAGVSLNIMSLGGLALGVGMLVDNSIVVLEAIDRRRREGHNRRQAAILGASEVSGAVTASTLTTVSVFFPIVFVEGIAGQLFYDQAVTVCFSLLTSLLVALTLIPALAAFEAASISGSRSTTLFAFDQHTPGAGQWSSLSGAAWTFILEGAGRRGGVAIWVLLLGPKLLLLVLLPALFFVQFLADRLYPWTGVVRLGPYFLAPIGQEHHWFGRILSVYLYPFRLLLMCVYGLLAGAWRLISTLFHGIVWPLTALVATTSRGYPQLLAGALRLRWVVLASAFVLFAISLLAVPTLGTQLVPDLSQGEFAFQLRFPEGTPLESTGESMAQIEATLARLPGIQRMFSLVGSLPSTASGRRTLGENLGQINLVLPEGASLVEEAAMVERVRLALEQFPNTEAELVRPSVLTVKPPVVVRVFADDLELLDSASLQVEEALRGLTGIVDVSRSLEPGNPEVRVELDRERAGALGVSPELLGQALRTKIRGDVVGQFREGEERLDIRLRASPASRERATDVSRLRIRLPEGSLVPISAVADVVIGRGPAAVHRSGGARVAEVTAKVLSADLGGALRQVRAALASLPIIPATQIELAGQDRELQVSYDSLKLMLVLAVFLVYVVMASQFESLLHPLVILIAVPLGMIGVMAALLLTGYAISVLVLIGAVMLAGIVVNNAIVLVDAVNRRRTEGEALDAAIIGAGGERLRPILMTTASTVLALLPMALGLGAGDELRAPLAVTVIGGLVMATLLTLVVIPCLYRIFSRDVQRTAEAGLNPASVPAPRLEGSP